MSSRSWFRWPFSLAAFLLGLVGSFWWQARRDREMLEQMEVESDQG